MDSCSLFLNPIENMQKHKEVFEAKIYKDVKSLKEGVLDKLNILGEYIECI